MGTMISLWLDHTVKTVIQQSIEYRLILSLNIDSSCVFCHKTKLLFYFVLQPQFRHYSFLNAKRKEPSPFQVLQNEKYFALHTLGRPWPSAFSKFVGKLRNHCPGEWLWWWWYSTCCGSCSQWFCTICGIFKLLPEMGEACPSRELSEAVRSPAGHGELWIANWTASMRCTIVRASLEIRLTQLNLGRTV